MEKMLSDSKSSAESVLREKEASFKAITAGYEREIKEKESRIREIEGEVQNALMKLKDVEN